MRRLRLYHAILAVLAMLAYASGEMGLIHAWLGYGVATVIVFRLGWALSGARELGLHRFYPIFTGLKLDTAFTHPAISRTLLLGIALSLIGVTVTGIAIDRGRAFRGPPAETHSSQIVGAHDEDRYGSFGRESEDGDESMMGELHEALANILIIFVVTHVAYLLVFKRPLAKFMLFLETPAARAKADRPK